jgi:hypothetical protein
MSATVTEIAREEIIDLLIIVSIAESGPVLLPLARACRRRGLHWTCFFTNDGVRVLEDPAIVEAIKYADAPIACEHSWTRYAGDRTCPITLGSQTDNSAVVARARKVIGL